MLAHQCHHGPEQYGQQHDEQRANQQRQLKCAVLVPGGLLKNKEGKIDDRDHVPGSVPLESKLLLAVDVAKFQRSDLAKLDGFAVHSLQIAGAYCSISVLKDLHLISDAEHFENALSSPPAHDVVPGYGIGVLRRAGHGSALGKLIWEIAVEESVPDCLTRPNFAFPRAVVGDEETNLRIRNQMQITVKVFRVSPVPDDPVAVPCFLIKAQRHRVHVGMIFKLAGMHQA